MDVQQLLLSAVKENASTVHKNAWPTLQILPLRQLNKHQTMLVAPPPLHSDAIIKASKRAQSCPTAATGAYTAKLVLSHHRK